MSIIYLLDQLHVMQDGRLKIVYEKDYHFSVKMQSQNIVCAKDDLGRNVEFHLKDKDRLWSYI